MQFNAHERARLLLDRAIVEGISEDEQRWLRSHTAVCAECSDYAGLSRRAIRALDGFAFELDPAAVLRIQDAVDACREQPAKSHEGKFSAALVIAVLLTIAGSIAMWQPIAWLAARWEFPHAALKVGFVMLWLLPSVGLDLLLLFRKQFIGRKEGQPA